MVNKRLTVLTKSDKKRDDGTYGYCVAGITEEGNWVRLVSDRNGQSLAGKEFPYNNLDVLDVSMELCPIRFQPENARLINCSLRGKAIIQQSFISGEEYIFVNNKHFLTEQQMETNWKSLALVEAKNFNISKNAYGKFKCSFDYNNNHYSEMSVTAFGFYKICSYKKAYIAVSLPSTPWKNGIYYKFVAAIYPY